MYPHNLLNSVTSVYPYDNDSVLPHGDMSSGGRLISNSEDSSLNPRGVREWESKR